ncbi:MAG: glycosyltransferase family 2 protein [Methylobacter sp.]
MARKVVNPDDFKAALADVSKAGISGRVIFTACLDQDTQTQLSVNMTASRLTFIQNLEWGEQFRAIHLRNKTSRTRMKTCIIIPVYNHEHAIPHVISRLKGYGIPCLLVNDGSSAACSEVLEDCARQESGWLTLLNRAENGGKGAAVIDGFNAAKRLGYTHALQIDADGQHNTDDISLFLETSRLNPDAMLLGKPVFDESVPKSRLYGHHLTNLCIVINTLSLAIADGMCGFRLYPLAAVDKLLSTTQIGQRMNYDVDIAVRLYWQGVEAINIPTAVHYPYDGVSHFRLWRDNVMIAKTHVSLFLGMLIRIPQLLLRHWR